MPRLWIASFNKGKLKEFKKLFEKTDFEIFSASDMDFYSAPEETGETFLENARIKAKSFKAMAPQEDWVVAEDSGLQVEALGGLPGVHSARYAGPKALDSQNNDKILKMLTLKRAANRNAHYFCQIVALGPNGETIEVDGICKGQIGYKLIGSNGFGYDPLFIPNGYEKTMAELSPAEKNKISHRTQATQKLLEKLV